MDWVASVIWWHCYPLRFVGGEFRADELPEGQVEHRLGRLEAWLDYLLELGASGLMLAPVFASTSHGYDTLDYNSIFVVGLFLFLLTLGLNIVSRAVVTRFREVYE